CRDVQLLPIDDQHLHGVQVVDPATMHAFTACETWYGSAHSSSRASGDRARTAKSSLSSVRSFSLSMRGAISSHFADTCSSVRAAGSSVTRRFTRHPPTVWVRAQAEAPAAIDATGGPGRRGSAASPRRKGG